MNDENLKGHGFHEVAPSVQREIASKGGIAKAEAARQRKTIAEALRQLLDEPGKAGGTSTRLEGIVAQAIQKLYRNPTMKDLKTLAEILGELKVNIDAGALQLNINASQQGADNIAALMKGGKNETAEE